MAAIDKLIILTLRLEMVNRVPGASMTKAEKLRIAKALEENESRCDRGWFCCMSPGDFESVKAIAENIKDSTVCSLARALDKDIDRAAEALKMPILQESTPLLQLRPSI